MLRLRATYWLLIAVIFPVITSTIARAQSEIMSMAPLGRIGSAQYSSDLEATNILAGVQRSIPVGILLPQVSSDSYLDFLRLLGGVQIHESNVDIRAHVTAVDFEIQKMPWAAAFGFLDIDASGFHTLDADWILLGIGPAINLGNRDFSISIRLVGAGSVNSTRVGNRLQFLEADVEKTRHAISYGLRGQAGINIQERLLLEIRYVITRYSIDTDIEYSRHIARLGYDVISNIRLIGGFERTSFSLEQEASKQDAILFGLVLTPGFTQ